MRHTEPLQANISVGPVNLLDQTVSLEAALEIAFPMPDHDADLPEIIEAYVHQAGILLQRRLFRLLIERADRDLVLHRRHGKAGQGIQCRGTRPYTFKTTFGEVTVERSRICHKADGSMEVPSATAWETPHQTAITQNLRDAVCDQMLDRSAREAHAEVCRYAEDEDVLGRSTVVEIVHQEGEQLLAAQRERARALLDDAPEARLALLAPTDPEAAAGRLEEDDDAPPCGLLDEDDDAPPCEGPGEAEAEWERARAEWAATGFPGCDPAPPVDPDEPRQVDPGYVIVEPDEVKTKAQPTTGRKEVWTYTATVLVEGMQYAIAEATAEGLWLQVAALLLVLGVTRGERRLLVLGDGASWIRSWFEGLGIAPKVMIVCWWHLRKRCYEQLSAAGGPKERRRALEKELLGLLWKGEVDAAIELLRGAAEWVRAPDAVEDLIGYLEKRRGYIPDYEQRRRAGLWIASTRVEKFNDWAVSERCKGRGMSWSSAGVVALAALEAARRNGELERWREDRALPEYELPGPDRMAA